MLLISKFMNIVRNCVTIIFVIIIVFQAFDNFRNLQTLVLFQCLILTDEAMGSFPSNLITLKSLAISGISSVTEEGLKSICKLKCLEQFYFDGVPLSTSILREICDNCNLTFLSLSSKFNDSLLFTLKLFLKDFLHYF